MIQIMVMWCNYRKFQNLIFSTITKWPTKYCNVTLRTWS